MTNTIAFTKTPQMLHFDNNKYLVVLDKPMPLNSGGYTLNIPTTYKHDEDYLGLGILPADDDNEHLLCVPHKDGLGTIIGHREYIGTYRVAVKYRFPVYYFVVVFY